MTEIPTLAPAQAQDSNGKAQLAEGDFVAVVNQDGSAIEGTPSAPRHWLGTTLLPEGARELTGEERQKADQAAAAIEATIEAEVRRRVEAELAARGTTPATGQDEVPPASATRGDLEKYAVESGKMTAEQAKGYANKDELHAALSV